MFVFLLSYSMDAKKKWFKSSSSAIETEIEQFSGNVSSYILCSADRCRPPSTKSPQSLALLGTQISSCKISTIRRVNGVITWSLATPRYTLVDAGTIAFCSISTILELVNSSESNLLLFSLLTQIWIPVRMIASLKYIDLYENNQRFI